MRPYKRQIFDAVELIQTRRPLYSSPEWLLPQMDADLSNKRLRKSCYWRDDKIFKPALDEFEVIWKLENEENEKAQIFDNEKRKNDEIAQGSDVVELGADQAENGLASEETVEYTEYYLNDFVIYNDRNQPVEVMESFKTLSCDGVISSPEYLVGAPALFVNFNEFSVGGLELTDHAAYAWINTIRRNGLWYRLGKSHPEYKDFFDRFVWKINLVKHLLNFIELNLDATLDDLCRGGRFTQFLETHHAGSSALANWAPDLYAHDFRPNVMKHAKFIYWQICWQIPQTGERNIAEHPFWSDSCFEDARLYVFGTKKRKANLAPREHTVVTPIAHKYFHPIFGNILKRYDNGISIRNNFLGVHIGSNKKASISISDLKELDTSKFKLRGRRPDLDKKIRGLLREHYEEVVVDGVSIRIGDFVEMSSACDENHSWHKAGGVWIGRVLEIFFKSARNKDYPEAMFRLLWIYDINQTILKWICKVDNIGDKREVNFA